MRSWVVLITIVLVLPIPVVIKLMHHHEAQQVELERVSRRSLSPAILASGALTYENEVKLVPEMLGRVQEILVREGQSVHKGELLLRLDPATYLAQVAQLEAAGQQSQLDIERQRVTLQTQTAKWRRYSKLREQGIVDAGTYEEITSQYELAQVELNSSIQKLRETQAQLKQSREQLAKTEFHAPISGKVTSLLIKVGETAVPSAMSIAGSDLLTIADTGSLYAEVNVDESDIARVAPGQEARIFPAAVPEQSWAAVVERVGISPRQNPGAAKSYPVKIHLKENDDPRFHPGMSCRAEIATRGQNAPAVLAVPIQAVKYEDAASKDDKARASVFVEHAGIVSQREIETGIADDLYVEIVGGLQPGESIVTGPAKTLHFLKSGDTVSPLPHPQEVARK